MITDTNGQSQGMPIMRRSLLKGAAALSACMVVRPSFGAAISSNGSTLTGLVVPQVRGLFGSNGATPWYGAVQIGTSQPGVEPQILKFALDTGSNFIWSTSSLCDQSGNSCSHIGDEEFHYENSTSFTWVTQTQKDVSFGPWGTMTVESGTDLFGVSGTIPSGEYPPAVSTTFYLAASYSGEQFAMLDWDGGIGFPCSSAQVDKNVSFFMEELLSAKIISADNPYVSFDWDSAAGTGTCQIGGRNPPPLDKVAGIVMPWSVYKGIAGAEYLWTTALPSWTVGTYTAANVLFCLDSGSSQFKGDTAIMNATLDAVNNSTNLRPNVVMVLGTLLDGSNAPGTLTIPPSLYEVEIQSGPDKGKVEPQFAPLGLTDLVLVGSVLMDQLYTVFEYTVLNTDGGYVLRPANMYLYNKIGGPKIISSGPSSSGSVTSMLSAG